MSVNNSPQHEHKVLEPEHAIEPELVRKYAILQETNDEEGESWYYFIKWNGNEKALEQLEKDLDSIDWERDDDNLSIFLLEIQVLVSEQTAKEMTKIDLNAHSFHRKFDGTLHPIPFNFKPKHSNNKKMLKVFNLLGYGLIEDFIDQEDIDPEDLVDHSETESDASLPTDEEQSDSSSSSESDSDDEEPKKKFNRVLPPASSLSRFARVKRRHRK